jgi:hypothetical protein
MRTVTFADPAVIRELQTHFVLLWQDRLPAGARPDPGTPEQARTYPEGGGGANILTHIAAPDGRVVLRLPGFWRTERYLAELRFGRELASAVGKLPHDPSAVRFTADRLDERMRRVAAERMEIERRHPAEIARKEGDSDVRRRHAALKVLEEALGPGDRPDLDSVEAVVLKIDRLRLKAYT